VKKVIWTIVLLISVFYKPFSVCASESCSKNYEKALIQVCIKPINDPKYLYQFETYNKNIIAYIVHYLTSMSLENGNDIVKATHVPFVWIDLTDECGIIESIGIFDQDFRNKDDFLYAGYMYQEQNYYIQQDEYDRFIEFVDSLKTQKLLFKDVPTNDVSDWAMNYVEHAKQINLLPRWNQIDYKKDISRLEVCQLTDNLLRIKNQKISDIKKYPFDDTEDKAIKELYNIGVIKGKTETEFFPYHNITREEFVKILYQVYEYMTNNSELLESEFDFADKGEISDWAIESIKNMASLGIIKGYEDGRFDPNGTITKEQAVVMLQRVYDLMK